MNSLLTIVIVVLGMIREDALADDCTANNPSLTRYFYDASADSCNKISLTVAVPTGQTNIYTDQFECNKRCMPPLAARCNPTTDIVRVTAGSASRTIFQYQKQLTREQCVAINPFSSYEVLPVGQNIFPSSAACTQACIKLPVCNVINPTPVTMFYFDQTRTNCVQFSSSLPKQPGSNMFESKAACKAACKPDPPARCKTTDPSLQVTANSAKRTTYYSFTNIRLRRCTKVTYGGYQTIPTGSNAFPSNALCEAACRKTPRLIPAYCKIAPTNVNAWYFDGTQCIAFTMTTTASPSGNAFLSEADCNNVCGTLGKPECSPTSASSTVTSSTARQTKYTYNLATGTCGPTPYGGTSTIPTGYNFFDSLALCKTNCEKPSECTASAFPTIAGKYFYDQASKSCSPVDLRVPLQTSSNVFASKNECALMCIPKKEPDCLPASSDNRVTKDSINRRLFSYNKKKNTCEATTYNGVVNIPDNANFFETQTKCEDKCLKSTTAISTKPKTTTAAATTPKTLNAKRDQYFECCAWASLGECDKNPLHMKVKCQESCGTFGATQATALVFPTKIPPKCRLPSTPYSRNANCSDEDVRCSSWGIIGQCISNKAFMALNCRATCNTCTAKTDDFWPDCNHGDGASCRNLAYDGCCARAADNQCLSNAAFMKTNCNAACNLCKAGQSASSAQNFQVQAQVIQLGGSAIQQGGSAIQQGGSAIQLARIGFN